jgi:hypothetical protein
MRDDPPELKKQEFPMKTPVFSLSVLTLAVLATSAMQAHAESSRDGTARITVAAHATQSWTVYAPSGRPVIMRPRQGDGRWWPSN